MCIIMYCYIALIEIIITILVCYMLSEAVAVCTIMNICFKTNSFLDKGKEILGAGSRVSWMSWTRLALFLASQRFLQLQHAHVEQDLPGELLSQITDLMAWGATMDMVEVTPELVRVAEGPHKVIDSGQVIDRLQVKLCHNLLKNFTRQASQAILITRDYVLDLQEGDVSKCPLHFILEL